jgi:glycosyltransferase involved in cell wall biosynthesis
MRRKNYHLKTYKSLVPSYHTHQLRVVIPTLNEAENLPHVLPYLPEWVDDVLLVDGGSSDNTVEVARQLWPSIRVIWQSGRGKGTALKDGFMAATGDIIVMMDADGDEPDGDSAFVAPGSGSGLWEGVAF